MKRAAAKFLTATGCAAVFLSGTVQADIFVQRGMTQLQYNNTEPPVSGGPVEAIVTLDTPVEVGKSFAISSARAELNTHDGAGTYLATAELTNIVDGKYTQLRLYKRRSRNNRIVRVEWQVVSGGEFSVQSGSVYGDDTATLTRAISAVDTNKTMLFFTINSEHQSEWRRSLVRGRITSPTQLEFYRYAAGALQDIVWYVVEWKDAIVRHGTVSIAVDGDTATSALPGSADLEKAFMFFTYSCQGTPIGEKQLNVRGRFTAPDELEFRRHEAAGPELRIAWFVVEHDKIQVQSGLDSMSDGVGEQSIEIPVFAPDLAKAFVPLGYMGNAYCDAAVGTGGETNGLQSQQLEKTGDPPASILAIRRLCRFDSKTLYASWFVVNREPASGTFVRFY